jgi:anthranilate phosphoribosyltransferase
MHFHLAGGGGTATSGRCTHHDQLTLDSKTVGSPTCDPTVFFIFATRDAVGSISSRHFILEKEEKMITEAIQKIVMGIDLTETEMITAMSAVIDGKVPNSQVAAFVTALRMKGETIEEITGAARAIGSRVVNLQLNNHLINLDRDDINLENETILKVGDTGNNNTRTFNVSTATAFVLAGGGLRIARHGIRSENHYFGSADVLASLGVKLDISSSDVEGCIRKVGIGFLFIPFLHGPMRNVAHIRKEMGIRTIFNLVSPLLNPAAGFVVSGLDSSFENGIKRAAEVIDSGRAKKKLEALVQYSRRCEPFVRKDLDQM